MTFKDLGLSQEILKAVSEKGYEKPSVIQEKAIPLVLEGKDVLASAQTGTGKTAGFTLPILHNLSESETRGKRPIRALILTPTRELAAQIYDNIKEYSKYLNIKSTVIFGGVNQNPQVRTLKQGVDILVATPGRLLDLQFQKALSLAKVDVLVLDEADRMLDMGFARDINKVLDILPKQRQNLLFSATFSKEIKALANNILRNPVSVEAAPQNTTAERVDHLIYKVDKGAKAEVTIKLIKEGDFGQVLVFTRTKYGADRLSRKLDRKGIPSAAIHGNKSQNQRTKALKNFKEGEIQVLVATDIAARGLDIPLLPYVINYELPNVPEDYVHRIGRTGRAGASGNAISLVDIDEMSYAKAIEKLLGEKIESKIIEGYEPVNLPTEKENKKKARPNRNMDARIKAKKKSNRNFGDKKKSNNGSKQSRSNNGGNSKYKTRD